MQGKLGDKLISDLVRDLGRKKSSGLLRLSKGKTIKAVFFDSGSPIFAISNLADEQLERVLINEGLATADQIDKAKQKYGKANQLGRSLVEMKVLTEEDMYRVVRGLVTRIVISLFEWDQGEYAFDERVRTAHDVILDWTHEDCILEGARHASGIENIAYAIAPPHGLVQSEINGTDVAPFRLTPVESYVLSRLDAPTTVGEVSSLIGLSEEETRRALCALLAVGILKRRDKRESTNEALAKGGETGGDGEDSADKLREDVSRKLHFFASADYYEILGVTRRATTSEIKAAYYRLAKRFHPDKYRQPEHSELRSKLEALFAKVTQAYETLSDGSQRAAYDDRTKSGATTQQPGSFATVESIPPTRKSSTGPLETDAQSQVSQIADDSPVQPQQTQTPPPSQAAEFYYQQGRARYDKKDYYAAVQLLREAVRLDASKPHYHFHLGIALTQNPRTRREGEAHLVKAAELDPFSAQIRIRLGMLYKENGLAKRAENYFREALTIDPQNRAARRELGMAGGGDKKDDSSIWKSDLGTIAKRIFKK